MPIHFTEVGGKTLITGKTFLVKEQIKIYGGIWNPQQKAWLCPKLLSEEERNMILEDLVVSQVESKNSWICCPQSVTVDSKLQHTRCVSHGYRVRGLVFTGD
jgi:hypothetical protein